MSMALAGESCSSRRAAFTAFSYCARDMMAAAFSGSPVSAPSRCFTNFVAFSNHLGDLMGQVFALFVLTVAAAEAAIGLAILVVFFRNRGSIAVQDINTMKG